MAQTAHTPGPWQYMADSLEIVRADDVQPVIATVHIDNTSEAQAIADARLIAEAPAYDEVAREMAAFHDAGKQVPKRVWQKLYDTIERASHPRATATP